LVPAKPTTTRRLIPFIGYGLAAGFLILAVTLYAKNAALLEKIEDAERADGERLLFYERQQQNIGELEAQTQALATRLRAALKAQAPRKPVDPSKTSREAGLPAEAAVILRDSQPSVLEDALGRGLSEESLRQSAELSVNMQYGDLFGLLGLPAERAKTFRAALTMTVASEMKFALAVAAGTGGAPSSAKPGDTVRAAAEVLLSEAEFAVFSEYQDALPERVAREAFSAQLAVGADGLTAENRTEALDILVEEMLLAIGGLGSDVEALLTAQREAIAAAGSRLEGRWSAEQFAIFTRFAAAQSSGLEAADGLSQ
jgi:hypothetical protein